MRKRERDFQVIKGKGRTRLPGLEKFLYGLIVLLVIVLLVQIGYQWVKNWWTAYRLQVEMVEPGSLRKHVEVEGMITRDEEVMLSPGRGVFKGKASPGERIATGEKAGTLEAEAGPASSTSYRREVESEIKHFAGMVNDSGETLRFPFSDERVPGSHSSWEITTVIPGLLSYRIDGLEGYGPGSFPYEYLEDDILGSGQPEQNEEDVPAEVDSEPPDEEAREVNIGDPLFKVVTGWDWYFSVVLENGEEEIASSEKVNLVFPFAEDSEVEAKQEELVEPESVNGLRITYRIEKHLPGFEEIRSSRVNLYYGEYKGVIAPQEAIKEREGEKGVYLNQGGVVDFQPVEVLFSREEHCVIEGVSPYSLVIMNPGLVEEGQRLE